MAQANFEPGTSRSRVLRSAHCATLAGHTKESGEIKTTHMKLVKKAGNNTEGNNIIEGRMNTEKNSGSPVVCQYG